MKKKSGTLLKQILKLFYLSVFGLLLSVPLHTETPLLQPELAQSALAHERTHSTSNQALEHQAQQARTLYRSQQFSEAIYLWQAIAQTYVNQSNAIGQASALSNLALSYQALGQWNSAQDAIQQSLDIASELDDQPSSYPTLAQIMMSAGILHIERGEPEQALSRWQQAEALYARSHSTLGINRALINQAQALREMGFYQRSLNQLEQAIVSIRQEPPSQLQVVALRRLGESLRLDGQLLRSERELTQSLAAAQQIGSAAEISAALLSLGHTALAGENAEAAQSYYQQALNAAGAGQVLSLSVPIQLAQLALFIDNKDWSAIDELWPTIQRQLTQLPPSRTHIYHQLSWAESLLTVLQTAPAYTATGAGQAHLNRVQIEDIAQQLQQAIEQARYIEDERAEAYGLGLLGRAYRYTKQWTAAETLTQRAIELSDRTRAKDSLYRWQWQLGSLWRDPNNPNRSIAKAIRAYDQAIDTLSELRGDLAAADAQFAFKTQVEPVYRELLDLLLQLPQGTDRYEQNLIHAQRVIESLRVAELDNYFREACADVQSADVIQADPNAAIIYTLISKDRLSILLNLPNQQPQHFITSIPESEINRIVKQLRQKLVIRSRRDYFAAAQQVYEVLIAPIRETLDSSGVTTLVFVPDGALQTVPLAALYDGNRFLIEDYEISLTPSLGIVNLNMWSQTNTAFSKRALIGGLTESRGGFPSLPYVAREIRSITRLVGSSSVLLNQTFTKAKLTQRLKDRSYRVVHIATHGQLGSTPEETFLVTWDGQINVREINQMLQANLGGREGIALLMLSACETAISDPKAGLGLAGVSLRSGASSTIGSLWAIDDEASAHFVETFYQKIMQPATTRAEALRKAQIALIQDPQYQHPIYWSAYVLFGSWL